MVNPILTATALSPIANSYSTVEEADDILILHPYTDDWDLTVNSLPSAVSYQSAEAVLAGVSELAVDTGSGVWTVGTVFQFDGHTTKYSVTTELSAAGTLKFSPVLAADVADNEAIERRTPNKKEQCLITTATIFDNLLVYKGSKRTAAQRLRCPRYGLYSSDGEMYDADTIPAPLLVASALFSSLLIAKDMTAAPAALGLGVSYAQLGPMEAKIDASMQEEVIPDFILALLNDIATLEPEAIINSSVLPTYRT